ncbi:hypothetical protein [Buchnera aphidicola]|uniref:hypothetical protein n=1 Tax=Buchnera aphidicola TaxID=9 RepID=UPI003D18A809
MPFFFGGIFSYDLISNFEYIKLFKPYKNKKQCSDFCFYLSENLSIFNYKKKLVCYKLVF